MSSQPVPEKLRRAVADDLAPVQPLPPAWLRTLQATGLAALGLALVLLILKLPLRFDLAELPMWLTWGCACLQLAIGVLLIGLALRESVPGQSVPVSIVATAIGLAVAIQVLVAIATRMHGPGMAMEAGMGMKAGLGCAMHDTALALPALLVTLWLVFRALPLRPSVAGLLGGAGSAVTADALIHVICPMSDLRHVLVWHTGTLLGLMLVGWLVGKAWEVARQRRRG